MTAIIRLACAEASRAAVAMGISGLCVVLLHLSGTPRCLAADKAAPSEANTAGQQYVEKLNEASAELWKKNSEIQTESKRKYALAQAEFDALTKKLRDEYVSKLKAIEQKATRERNTALAAETKKKIDVLLQGAPRNSIQELWMTSYEAEQVQDYKGAIAAVEQAIQESGRSRNTYANLRLGWLHYLQRDYEKAIDYYKQAARSAPRAVSPQLGLMNCYVAVEDSLQAMNSAKHVLSRSPSNRAANSTAARLLFEKKDYEGAAEHYGALVSRYPEDMEMWSGLAWCWARQGKREAAQSVFLDVLAVEPMQLSALTGYAEVASVDPKAKVIKE